MLKMFLGKARGQIQFPEAISRASWFYYESVFGCRMTKENLLKIWEYLPKGFYTLAPTNCFEDDEPYALYKNSDGTATLRVEYHLVVDGTYDETKVIAFDYTYDDIYLTGGDPTYVDYGSTSVMYDDGSYIEGDAEFYGIKILVRDEEYDDEFTEHAWTIEDIKNIFNLSEEDAQVIFNSLEDFQDKLSWEIRDLVSYDYDKLIYFRDER